MINNNLESPIILIGTHRSGTSWLFNEVFSQHPDLACWKEPRYVWEWGNNYKPDDILTPKDATEKIVKHIRSRFTQFVESQGKKRLFEKTPNNCLRLPFIHYIYPQAKIIHIIRDGRAVFASSANMVEKGYYRQEVLTSRLGEMLRESPWWGIPSYFPTIANTVVSKLLKRPIKYWGPRPQGWRDWLKEDSLNVILAKQWASTMNQALDDGEKINPQFYRRFYYEDLMAEPLSVMENIVNFLELDQGEIIIDYVVKTVNPEKQDRWREALSQDVLKEIEPHVKPTLERLSYEW